ncbi:hypothetical protein ECEC1869_2885, partial [Escherichia coli EC1869]
MIIRFC